MGRHGYSCHDEERGKKREREKEKEGGKAWGEAGLAELVVVGGHGSYRRRRHVHVVGKERDRGELGLGHWLAQRRRRGGLVVAAGGYEEGIWEDPKGESGGGG